MSLMGMGDYTYANAFCAKQYAVEADFDGMLFSTADQNLVFNAYYSSLYDGWGGIGLSRMPDRNAAAPSSKQQFSVWADGGANGTETYAVFYDSNSPTEMYPEYLSESGYPTIDLVEPRIVAHLYIANSTWVYNYFTGADSDSFQVKITGSLGGKGQHHGNSRRREIEAERMAQSRPVVAGCGGQAGIQGGLRLSGGSDLFLCRRDRVAETRCHVIWARLFRD